MPINGSLRSENFIGSNPFIAGWGALREEDKEMSKVLQQTQITVYKKNVCEIGFKKEGAKFCKFGECVICAGDLSGTKDTCRGDSGGPLMIPIYNEGTFSFYQIGVISHGIGCARPFLASIFTNVTYFSHWIDIVLKK